MIELLDRARGAKDRLAVVEFETESTYEDVVAAAERIARSLLAGADELHEARVAFLVPPGRQFVAVQWATWMAGGISVPLCVSHPEAELDYVVNDSDADFLISSDQFKDRLEGIAVRRNQKLLQVESITSNEQPTRTFADIGSERRALLVYTSGSTGAPKGVVWTHASLQAQLEILSEAWAWSPDDRTLLVLPLHHVHGLVNVLTCALWNSAVCEVLPSFDVDRTWDRLASRELTVFMAVPTVYHHLITSFNSAPPKRQAALRQGASELRLMVCGSAALPVPLLEEWERITGHRLLERYGMTEIGMALSNPYEGERRPGKVGLPLPRVELRLRGSDGDPVPPGSPGAIEVRGPSVFKEYWRKPHETKAAFTQDGWFRTGDVAIMEADEYYRILGRESIDIIKTGGEKVSALEIEDVLRGHPSIVDCAVIGLPDPEWGEQVSVVIIVGSNAAPTLEEIRDFARTHLAPYKLPRSVHVLDELPRNAMGKVVKPVLRARLSEK
jgi:malonyl-CoA/methylmalonyl-CoA synthetase